MSKKSNKRNTKKMKQKLKNRMSNQSSMKRNQFKKEVMNKKEKLISEIMKEQTTNENMVNNSNEPQKEQNGFPHGIKQPTNVIEFRENLKKYFFVNDTDLYVLDENGMSMDLPLESISSFDDIHKLTKSGTYGRWGSPFITPKVVLTKDVSEYMKERNQLLSFKGYFMDEQNFEIVENPMEFIRKHEPKWFKLDNQWLREFYWITLGDYCGYSFY